MKKTLTHVDEQGNAAMVDVGHKERSPRTATASGEVTFPSEIWRELTQSDFVSKKGSILQTAVIAGTMAVKRTADLIPLCHPLPLDGIDLQLTPKGSGLRIVCEVRCQARTGVEMEALTGVSVAALTVYDMTKALSHEIIIENIQLEHKSGGKHDYERAR